MNRHTCEPEGFEEEIEAAYLNLSLTCLQNVFLLEEALEQHDPNPNPASKGGELCGVLDGRIEVYIMKIEQCYGRHLAISIKRGRTKGPIMIHGPTPARAPCAAARRLVQRHRKLHNPAWEAATT